jgi:hypothetical protein
MTGFSFCTARCRSPGTSARPGADLPEPLHGQVQIPGNLCTARFTAPGTCARRGSQLPEPVHGCRNLCTARFTAPGTCARLPEPLHGEVHSSRNLCTAAGTSAYGEVHSSRNLCTARCTVAGASARRGSQPSEPVHGQVPGCRSLCAAKCAASGSSARRAFPLLGPLRGKLRGCQSLCTGTFAASGSATKLENHSFRASRSSKNWLWQLASQGTRSCDFWIFRVRRPAGRQRKNEKSTPNLYSERKDHFQYGKKLKLSAGHNCPPTLTKKFWGRGAPTIS